MRWLWKTMSTVQVEAIVKRNCRIRVALIAASPCLDVAMIFQSVQVLSGSRIFHWVPVIIQHKCRLLLRGCA